MISGIIIGFLIGAIIIYILRFIVPAKQVDEANLALREQEKKQQNQIFENQKLIDSLGLSIAEKRDTVSSLQEQTTALETAYQEKKKAIEEQISTTYQLKEEQAKAQYEKSLEITEQEYENNLHDLLIYFLDKSEEYKNEYQNTLLDFSAEFQEKAKIQQEFKDNLSKIIDELQSKVDAAVEVAKRAEAERTQKDFYRINLSKEDIEEISKLRSVAPSLRNREPLDKVIWKTYYEKPTSDLLGRVTGKTIKTGIYKITNLENNMCYVGQAVDIASRWKQHIKRGIGAETPTKNKLYPAMLATGVENFTFEIIEECEAKNLDALEDYWQEFYHAKDFGYSIK